MCYHSVKASNGFQRTGEKWNRRLILKPSEIPSIPGNRVALVKSGYSVRDLDRLADVPPAGEIPGIREAAALVRLHGLDPAVAALEKNAGPVRLVDQGEPVARRAQAGEFFHKIPLIHSEMRGNRRNVRFADLHKSRPPAAIRATLAEEIAHRASNQYRTAKHDKNPLPD